jgi:hypothetical protein
VTEGALLAGAAPAGGMAARVRAFDWARTPLGPAAAWPASLRATVRTLLSSRYPMVLTWGPAFTQTYNDAYAAIIGQKHPGALGDDLRGDGAGAGDQPAAGAGDGGGWRRRAGWWGRGARSR